MASSEIRTKQNMSIAASSAIRVLKNENPSKIEDIKTWLRNWLKVFATWGTVACKLINMKSLIDQCRIIKETSPWSKDIAQIFGVCLKELKRLNKLDEALKNFETQDGDSYLYFIGYLRDDSQPARSLVTDLKVKRLACGSVHALAVCSDGSVYSWGSPRFGRLGREEPVTMFHVEDVPRKVLINGGLELCVDVGAGYSHSFAVNETGDLFGWGCNTNGRIGLPVFSSVVPVDDIVLAPTIVPLSSECQVSTIIAGSVHSAVSMTLAGSGPGEKRNSTVITIQQIAIVLESYFHCYDLSLSPSVPVATIPSLLLLRGECTPGVTTESVN